MLMMTKVMIRKVVVDEDGSVKLLGSTTEFKIDGSDERRIWPQMFANMARVANMLMAKSLEFGYLVSTAWVYRLLTKYSTEMCTPMFYEVNFNTNEAHFYIGVDMHFSNCLALVSLKMNS